MPTHDFDSSPSELVDHRDADTGTYSPDPGAHVRNCFNELSCAVKAAIASTFHDAGELQTIWHSGQLDLYKQRGSGKDALSTVALIIREDKGCLVLGWGRVKLRKTRSPSYVEPRAEWRGVVGDPETVELTLIKARANEHGLIRRCDASAVRIRKVYRDVVALRTRIRCCHHLRTYAAASLFNPPVCLKPMQSGPRAVGEFRHFDAVNALLGQIRSALIEEVKALVARFRTEQARLDVARGGPTEQSPISIEFHTHGRLMVRWRLRTRVPRRRVRRLRWMPGPVCDMGTVTGTLPRRNRRLQSTLRSGTPDRISASALLREAPLSERGLLEETDAALGNVIRAFRDLDRIHEVFDGCTNLAGYAPGLVGGTDPKAPARAEWRVSA